jgi:hypothetical protein
MYVRGNYTQLPPLSHGQSAGYTLLQRLHGPCQSVALWFVHQQVNVFGHDHVSVHAKTVVSAHSLQCIHEGVLWVGALEVRTSAITTES